MKENAKWKKTLVWVLSILGLLIILIIAGLHWFKKDIQSNNSKSKPLVTKEVKKVVTEASDSLYRVTFSNFNFKIDSGYADISNFKMTTDTAILNKLENERKVPNNIITAKADKIVVSKFGLEKVQNEQTLHIVNMRIDNLYVYIKNRVRSYNDTAHTKSLIASAIKSLFKSIDTDNIVEAKVDNIFMNNTTLVYVNDNEKTSKSTSLRNLDITLSNVSTGAIANKTGTQKNDAVLKVGHQKIVTADKLYNIDFDNIRLVPADKKIFVGSFSLTPRLSKAEFIKAVKAKQANYRYNMQLEGISMNDINFDKIARRQQLYIPNVTIDDSKIEIFTNYNWPLRTPPNRRDKFPNELLQKLAFDVTIGKMIQKHGNMLFKIVAKKSEKEALFTMNDIYAVSTNITNNAEIKKQNAYSTTTSDAKVMNTGRLHSKIIFNLNNSTAPVTISSTLGPLDGTAFNPLSKALSMMEIKSAQIEKMNTTIHVDEYRAKGNVDFYYKNMKVRLLKKDEGALKKMSVVSFFANVMLPNDNPKKNGKFRKGPINIVRDPRESFFGFIWRGMLDGMSSAMSGMDQQKKEPGNKVVEMAKIFMGPKQGQEEKSAGGDKERLNKLKNKKKH